MRNSERSLAGICVLCPSDGPPGSNSLEVCKFTLSDSHEGLRFSSSWGVVLFLPKKTEEFFCPLHRQRHQVRIIRIVIAGVGQKRRASPDLFNPTTQSRMQYISGSTEL